MLPLIAILPYSILVVLFGPLIWAVRRVNPSLRPFLHYALVGDFVLSMGATIWLHYGIVASELSTAAIGYISLPFLSLAAAVAGFPLSWSCYYIVRFAVERLSRASRKSTSAPAFLMALFVLGFCVAIALGVVVREMRLATATESADPGSLQKIIDHAVSSYDLEMLSRLAENPNVSAANLTRIYGACSHSTRDINVPEYAVFFSLADNPHTPPDILAALARRDEVSIRIAVGTNPLTSIETLHALSKDPDPRVREYVNGRR